MKLYMPATMTITSPFTPQKLRTFVQSTVREELHELLNDPDFGRELRPLIAKRLRAIAHTKKERLLSANDVIDRLGLGV